MRIKVYSAAAISATETKDFFETTSGADFHSRPLQLGNRGFPIGLFVVDVSSITSTWGMTVKLKTPVTGALVNIATNSSITDGSILVSVAGFEVNGVALSSYIMVPNLKDLVVTTTETPSGVLSCELYLYVPD